MRHIVGSVGVLLAVGFLAGCSPAQHAKTQSPNDVFGVMDKELTHSLVGKADTFDAMDSELSHAIGTTSLTSDVILGPMPLPGARMSIAKELKAPQTWGVSLPEEDESTIVIDATEIPDTRD